MQGTNKRKIPMISTLKSLIEGKNKNIMFFYDTIRE